MAKQATKKTTRNKERSAKHASATSSTTARTSLNQSLSAAKAAKKDEFYTQYIDIQKEVEAYLEYDPDMLCRNPYRPADC